MPRVVYVVDLKDEYSGETVQITASSPHTLLNRINKQKIIWEKEARQAWAEAETKKAQGRLNRLRSILADSLSQAPSFEWEKLKWHQTFPEPKPVTPALETIPPEPKKEQYSLSLFAKVIALFSPKYKEKALLKAAEKFETAHTAWVAEKKEKEAKNASLQADYAKRLQLWKQLKQRFKDDQTVHNLLVEAVKRLWKQSGEGEVSVQLVRKELKGFFQDYLALDDEFDWTKLEKHETFQEPYPEAPALYSIPPEPQREDYTILSNPISKFLARISSTYRRGEEASAEERFRKAHKMWQDYKEWCEAANASSKATYARQVQARKEREKAFEYKQALHNFLVETVKESWEKGLAPAVRAYNFFVLDELKWPEDFPRDREVEYIPETKTLIVNYALPVPEQMPNLKEIKYIKTRDDFKEEFLSAKEQGDLYDKVLYQMALVIINTLFQADSPQALGSIAFTGWVTAVNKATGQEQTTPIMTFHVSREEYSKLNLRRVDPKECFRGLKGVAASKLAGLAPIAPVLRINREDSRFITPRDVAERLDEGDNLATMDWQDFEQLVRQLFEWKFKEKDAEVKITQASRDRGIDAVVFIPDPISGGKIVIQAKRYTKVVPVAAVRELNGILNDEGAMKGILITTSDYGPESYEFAKDKPITLINGNELLHMLAQVGVKARIDLEEARKLLKEEGF